MNTVPEVKKGDLILIPHFVDEKDYPTYAVLAVVSNIFREIHTIDWRILLPVSPGSVLPPIIKGGLIEGIQYLTRFAGEHELYLYTGFMENRLTHGEGSIGKEAILTKLGQWPGYEKHAIMFRHIL